MAADEQNFTATADPERGELRIVLHAQQDAMVMAREWPRGLVTRFPGPWNKVVVDLTKCTNFTSSFIAGLMIFHRTWNKGAGRRIVLVGPSELLKRSMQTLNIMGMFQIEG